MNNVITYYERELERKIEELNWRAKSLSTTLSRIVKDIDERGVDASINTCGEIQSSGTVIDDLCKEIGKIKEFISTASCMIGVENK